MLEIPINMHMAKNIGVMQLFDALFPKGEEVTLKIVWREQLFVNILTKIEDHDFPGFAKTCIKRIIGIIDCPHG